MSNEEEYATMRIMAAPAEEAVGYVAPGAAHAFGSIVGTSEAIQRAIALSCRVAAHTRSPVLLHGETGTGKELFARGIHNAGEHSGQPFVGINCAALPENLLESELFGHERGAFSGATEQKRGLLEVAGRGTIFLDEVGELPIELQPKLLRVLEERCVRRVGGLREQEIECRIIAATNRDLATAVDAGTFRADLYFRLSVLAVELPPLRERTGDVELLARYFVEKVAREHGVRPKELAAETLNALRGYTWPGNVRELRNAMEGALVFAEGAVLLPEHVRVRRRYSVPSPMVADGEPPAAAIVLPRTGMPLREAEKQLIEATLRLAGYNQSEAARMLQISRPTLTRKIRSYGLRLSDSRDDPRDARS
jgi:transcriptional regulator with PAS, ATPase and Fis domain